MKKLISSLLLAFVSVGAMAGQDTKEYKTYVKNDHHVFYCTHHGVHVVVDPTEGGIFEPHITIINESGHDFVFEPQKIKAYAFAIPGNTYKETRYRTERFVSKGDTLGFEKDKLTLYSPEKYVRKRSNSMWWSDFVGELIVAGVESLGPQDKDSQYWNEVRREHRIEDAEDARHLEKARISEGYWRANTIFDNSEHEGFIAIKKVKTQYLILDIPVDGENFHFLIDNNKHY
jgi:hypothetical protein